MHCRRDRGYHFLNFHAVVDNDGYFQLLRGGFLGHATDAHSLEGLPTIGYQQQLHLPRGACLPADGGYPAAEPLLIPFRRQRRGRLDWVRMRYRVNIELKRVRTYSCGTLHCRCSGLSQYSRRSVEKISRAKILLLLYVLYLR